MGSRIVVIGAGVVGAALADELSSRGCDDVTVVEQGPLPRPGGSSSHAPGLVFQTNPAKVMTGLAGYTVTKLGSMDFDGDPCFRAVGSLEVATTAERLRELHRRHGWATSWGLPARVLTAAQARERHDLLGPDVLGALHVPGDGLVDSVAAVGAQLRAARRRGVRVLDRHEVLAIRTHMGRVAAVVTDHGELPADVVVCCAGIWGPRVARLVGLDLPLVPLAHQLAWSEPLPALAATAGAVATRPIVRHQGADLYLRERFDRLGVGSYAHAPMPVDPDAIAGVDAAEVMPSVLPFTPDDFTAAWHDAGELVPALRGSKVTDGINGLFSFTTDNLPLLGPSQRVPGFWVAEAVWVTHSAGVGRAIAEWLVDGACASFDLRACDINRFEPHQLSPAYVRARACQNFAEVYDIIHPLDPTGAPRPMRTSPFYPRQRELGGYFLETAGWERPQWYEANADLLHDREIPVPNAWAARHWSPIVGAEALVARATVALFDMTPLKRVEVSGSGATAFLQWMTTGDVTKPVGSVTYCLLLGPDGGIRSDVTVARLGERRYQVGVNGNSDLDWLARHAPDDGGVQVRDLTPGTCGIGVWGPRARDVVQSLTRDDFSGDAMRYFRATETYLGTVPVTALRLSYVGELGWELYCDADQGLALWDALWAAGRPLGMIAAGRGAFTSMRLEKGYRSFGADMSHEHDPSEAGLSFAVKLDKGDFLGRDAAIRRAADGPRRRLTCLTIADPSSVVLGQEPVYAGGTPVGHVTSAGYGYTVGLGIAYAWLPSPLCTPGTTVHIGYFDELVPAVVAAEPLLDPRMTRLRG